jgi:alpha-beta hydrolase superfamily lysophospholipase
VGRRLALVAVLLGALSGAGSAAAATPQELTITAADGTPLACALVEPDGTPPATGWPAVMLFHGLGGKHEDMEPLATGVLAPAGYASLMCDARGHGTSGGLFGLDGPADVADTQMLFNWLAARPEISDTEIGALGISLGGGAVWNAAAAGVPFKAIVPVITWTNLTTSLAPQGLSKSGLVTLLAQEVPTARWDPDLLAAESSLVTSTNIGQVATLAAPRSVLTHLSSLTVPTLLLQGRHDFLFDIDQAEAAYKLLEGPKRLYLGDLGHPPGISPATAPDAGTYWAEAVQWFDRFLQGKPNGVDKQATVELAHDPWDGKTTTFTGLPATKTASVELPGTTTITTGGKVVRGARLTGGPHETFGDSTVTVRYSGAKGWDRLVAVLTIAGQSTPISAGGIKLSQARGVATIRLMNESVLVPAGAKLVVYLGATSTVQNSADALYLDGVQPGSSITIGRETLDLSVLTKAVSR